MPENNENIEKIKTVEEGEQISILFCGLKYKEHLNPLDFKRKVAIFQYLLIR